VQAGLENQRLQAGWQLHAGSLQSARQRRNSPGEVPHDRSGCKLSWPRIQIEASHDQAH
jgi:hypothetical protein